MTLSLTKSNSCTSNSFKIGDTCQFTLSIDIPSGNSTTLYIELFTSDLNSSYAQICKPSISIDAPGFPGLAIPSVDMVSDFISKSQVKISFNYINISKN